MNERLTIKTKNFGYLKKPMSGENEIYTKEDMLADLDNIVQKLGRLEDIEEELGIDLLALFKAMNEGAWFKDPRYNHEGEIYFSEAELYKSPQGKEKYSLYETTRRFNFRLKDYGKNWALTKEELE